MLTVGQLPEEVVSASIAYMIRDSAKKGRTIDRHYTLGLGYDGVKKPSLPADSALLNALVGEAVGRVYRNRVGNKYIDVDRRREHDGLTIAEAVIPKVMKATTSAAGNGAPQDVLQLDVAAVVANADTCAALLARIPKGPDYARRAATELVGEKVMTRTGREDIMLKIFKVLTDEFPTKATGLRSNSDGTYVEYFKTKYNIDLDPKAPLLLCRLTDRRDRRVFIYPSDVVSPMSVPESKKRVLPLICSIYPHERMAMVRAAVKRILESKEATGFLTAYGIKLGGGGLLQVTGRVLRAPTIYIPNNAGFIAVDTTSRACTGPQGFASELAKLRLPARGGGGRPYSRLLFDRDLRCAPVLKQLLTKYNVNAPAPEEANFGNMRNLPATTPDTFCVVNLRGTEAVTYNAYKRALSGKGVPSQMVAKPVDRTIPDMIVQQIAAKIGQMCFLIDAGEHITVKQGESLLIIGADVGMAFASTMKGSSNVRQTTYTAAFVAFNVKGKEWTTYCNHYQVKGQEMMLFKDDDSASETASSAPTQQAGARTNPSEAIALKMDAFLKETVAHFNLSKSKGTAIVYRGSTSEGEISGAGQIAATLRDSLRGWECAVVAMQARSHTRFAWDVSAALPSADVAANQLVNVPGGFCTTGGADRAITKADGTPVPAFFITGTGCTLGHASNAYYAVLGLTPGIKLEELKQLTYAMCFMYPNKPSSLPAPLPMKCASEYGRKFGSLPELLDLQPKLRTTMHYL